MFYLHAQATGIWKVEVLICECLNFNQLLKYSKFSTTSKFFVYKEAFTFQIALSLFSQMKLAISLPLYCDELV